MAKNKTDSIESSSVAVGFAIYRNPVKVGLIAKSMLKGAVLSSISVPYMHSKLFSILKRRFVSLIAKTGSGFLRIRAK